MTKSASMLPRTGDALIVVDVQNDFLPGGSLAVPDGDAVVGVLNRYIGKFAALGLPVIATRDWHPHDHCSFVDQGGIWPSHCVAGSDGACFSAKLDLPDGALIVSKADNRDKDAYSGFEDTGLARRLRRSGVTRIFVGGLATDYCVLNTVLDGRRAGFDVLLLIDAMRPVDVNPGDGDVAIDRMLRAGATAVDVDRVTG